MASSSGAQLLEMPKTDGAYEITCNTEVQHGTLKRKLDSNEGTTSRKRCQGEDVLSTLFAQPAIESNSFVDKSVREEIDVSQTNLKGALDQIFAKIPKAHLKNTKQEFYAAARAFTRGSIKPSGSEKWSLQGMATTLLSHQLLGAGFMRRIEKNHHDGLPIGGILADDMGLGKTLQILAVILNNRPSGKAAGGTTLYVVPSVELAVQVTREMQYHFERGNGVKHVRWLSRDNLDEESYTVEWLQDFTVVVTTYPSLRSSFTKGGPLHKVNFFRVVFDEGHYIRNHRSSTFKSCHALEAKFKHILTGTPVVNSLKDLYAYFRLLRVADLGEFRHFSKLLREDEEKNFPRLKKMATDILLRRMKSSSMLGRPIIPLTKTTYDTIITTLGKHEQSLYDQLYKGVKAKLKTNFQELGRAIENRSGAVESGNGAEQSKKDIFKLLQTLRQVVGNPLTIWNEIPSYLGKLRTSFLLVKELTDSYGAEVIDEKLQVKFAETLLKPKPHPSYDGKLRTRVHDWFTSGGWPLYSSKLKAARDQLDNWISDDPDKKILIFTNFLDMVDIFSRICENEGWNYATYTGKMESAQRQESLRRLNNDENLVLIMTAQSGSVGLNLAAACRVLIFDLWWNLAQEEQARSRVERLGQKNDVEIKRIAAKNTIDEKIMQIQFDKASTTDKIMHGTLFNQSATLKDIYDILVKDAATEEDDSADVNGLGGTDSWNGEEVCRELEKIQAFNDAFGNEDVPNEEHYEEEDSEHQEGCYYEENVEDEVS